MRTYPTEELADARVTALRRIGIWPAVIPQADGRFRLSVDLAGPLEEEAHERGLPVTHRRGGPGRPRRGMR
jgi:hypothetical protein